MENQRFAKEMQARGKEHLAAMKVCYDGFLSSMRKVLSKEQYSAMISCLKKHADKAKKPIHKKPIKKNPKKKKRATKGK